MIGQFKEVRRNWPTIQAGALPVFAEIDDSFNIDPADIERKITPQTKAIMAVHLQGNPADMDPIVAIARKHGLKGLEASQFEAVANEAEKGCPVSNAYRGSLQITLDAKVG